MNLSSKSFLNQLLPAAKTLAFSLFLLSCATYNVQKGKSVSEISNSVSQEANDYQIFLVGDAGNADQPQSQQTLDLIKNKLDSANQNSLLIFLGDNIYPLGMPPENDKNYLLAKEKLENQLKITQDFKGKAIVIPGNHDWYHGLEGLKAQENFVKSYLNDKKAFLPKNSCPIDDINLTKDIKLIVLDSEWALINWDKHPGINKDCDIKTREDFYAEFKDLIIKNQDKRIIVALHHPVISSGTHAGFTSAKSHLFPFGSKVPLPGIASFLNILRNTSGVNMEDLSNSHYTEFAGRIQSIIQDKTNVVLISGHDHNLQYHEKGNIRQIVSGAASKTDPATIFRDSDFSFGGSGFAVLNVRKDQSTDVEFFSTKNSILKKLTQISVIKKPENFDNIFTESFPATVKASVYSERQAKAGKFYSWLWGNHYRKYYALPVDVPTANLATLNGGFTPFREGGGNQSNSLRLKAKDGQEFVMRAVKKSAVRFLNAQAFKKNAFGNELENTFPDRFLMDFYTTSHPFTNLAVGNLVSKVGLYHSNPKLYFIPKQKALGEFNRNYGNEMYLIEERFSSDPTTLESLDHASDIISTQELLKNLRKNSRYSVDEANYIRARLFDMLIGDWDRHEDQWKWAEYKREDEFFYKPIPRDHDQAFSRYDGAAFKIIMNIPAIRHMKSFDDDIKNIRWINMEPYPLDLILTKKSTLEEWLKEAKYIQENLTDADIEKAFTDLPKEVQDETIEDLQQKLKIRKTKLQEFATRYYDVLQEKIPLAGTVKRDRFVIVKNEKSVYVEQFEIEKEGNDKLVFEKTYYDSQTKELWIYGLEDDDVYEVSGSGKPKINIRLIGGYNHDTYDVKSSKVKIYDFKAQKNTYTGNSGKKHLTNDYELNTYNWKLPKYSFFAGFPNINFNPDDGVIVGLVANYTVNNFVRDPFTQKHTFSANYYTSTGGFNVGYRGVFKKAVFGWDAGIDAKYTTPFFARTFFGLGNETRNDADEDNRDYNRVRISQFKFAPSISTTSWLNFTHQFQLNFEHSKVQTTADRFVAVSPDVNPQVFNGQQFAGANYSLTYKNLNNKAFPTLGLEMMIQAAWLTNLSSPERNFTTYKGNISFYHRIDKKGKFVFANASRAILINNNNFEFYQAAAIGGNNGMRAYRNERFAGKSSFVNNSEIRWDFGRVKNRVVPLNMGILVGYDIGRVWLDGESSDKWHQGVGGGFWLNIIETFSARIDYFTGEDGGRISGGIGLSF
ncbi:metallophosphoesterase [Chryseobacterium sp. Leaf180]|uniref:metallophosphoesterase n=1 Tax=Chryseobacterium sp. Leaf180 TaxID=1736289 RepID=UPI0006F23A5A|nr:metallophosphoesterase [Chryseobacterium sp. Leaf180]KQR93571.1 metallophosphoesterase [Chryseobacterium sp. Leaf180]